MSDISKFPAPIFETSRVRLGMMTAIPSLLGGGLSFAGSLFGASGAKKAAKKAANIAASQNWTDMLLGERAYEDQQPFRDVGSASVNRLAMLLGLGGLPGVQRRYVPQNYNDPFFNQTPAPYYGFGMADPSFGGWGSTPSGSQKLADVTAAGRPAGSAVSSTGGLTPDKIRADQAAAFDLFTTDPGYQFRKDEGNKAIERSAAARGGVLAGSTMKDLDRFSQNIASDEYGNYINRLFNLAGFGPTATNASAQSSLGFTGLGQQARLAEGQARGSGYANSTSAMNQGINNLLTIANTTDWRRILGGSGGGGSWFGGPSLGGFAGGMIPGIGSS